MPQAQGSLAAGLAAALQPALGSWQQIDMSVITQAAIGKPCRAGLASRHVPRACCGLQPPGGLRPSRLTSPLLASPAAPLHCRRRRRCRRAPAAPPQAALWSLPDDLYRSLQTGCGVAYLLALGFSALPILTGDSKERNERRYLRPDADESAGAGGTGGAVPEETKGFLLLGWPDAGQPCRPMPQRTSGGA